MRRLIPVSLLLASTCLAQDHAPTEVEISEHRREVYTLSRDFVVETFGLQVIEESRFNPVRFNSNGVWGDFEARIKELGADRYEVQGWVYSVASGEYKTRWSVHIRVPIEDPEAWRRMRVDEVQDLEPEVLGWKFGAYRSRAYKAAYDPEFYNRVFK